MEIKFKDVSFAYNTNTSIENKVLNNINITFEPGKVYGLIGKSGSGKTSLIQLINGLLLPTTGKIMLGKHKIDAKTRIATLKQIRKNVGIVFQNSEEQFFCHTVKEEIEFGIMNFAIKIDDIYKKIIDALKIVGLDSSYLERDPLSLSHGEMRKIALASILVYNPKIIILDEPTIGLDDLGKKNLIKIIRKLKLRYDKTFIIVSHDTNFLLQIVDYVYLLENGEIKLSGDKYTILSDEKELKKNNILVPDILAFSNLVQKKKNIKLGFRDDINDLIKDIYRHVK